MNELKPTITIVIATWNAQKTLQRCLDSIRPHKGNGYIEVLVVDGGSKDSTLEIVKANLDVVDRWISEKDRGIYDAWNKGIGLAQGQWISFIGADDMLEPDASKHWRTFLEEQNHGDLDYICAKNQWVDENDRPLKIFGSPWNWSQERQTMKVAHVASLHHRRLFQELGQYDLHFRICGDYEFLLRKKDVLKSGFIDQVIARMATGGASYSVKALEEAHQIRKRHSMLSNWRLGWIKTKNRILFERHKWMNRQ